MLFRSDKKRESVVVNLPKFTFSADLMLADILGAAAFVSQLPAIRREVRPIYIRRGILPTLDSLQAVDTVVEESERQTTTPIPIP